MNGQLQRIPISIDDQNGIWGAIAYLAALAHPDNYRQFDQFVQAVRQCSSSKRLDRAAVRALDRTADKIYTIRCPAAYIAMHVNNIDAADGAGRIRTADHLTITRVIAGVAPRLPKHRSPANCFSNVWVPSKPVLHLAVGFSHHVLGRNGQPVSLLALIRRWRLWLPDAVSAALFQAVMLRKRIDGMDCLVEIETEVVNKNADMAAQVLPDLRYRKTKIGNAEWLKLSH